MRERGKEREEIKRERGKEREEMKREKDREKTREGQRER